jgi:uncharacterized membrane-anchored protein YjiN (DUF445 family)
MNQESYHEYYVVDATMYFNIPDFAKNRIGEKNIDLHVYHVGDSKMKKDTDPRLELVENKKLIEKYKNELKEIDHDFSKYNPKDELLDTYEIKTFASMSLGDLYDWLKTDISDEEDEDIFIEIFGDQGKNMTKQEFIKNFNLEKVKDFINKNITTDWDIKLNTPENLEKVILDLIKDNLKGDSKMKKDSDPRLELVEKIKNYMLIRHYDLNDKFIAGCIDERFLDSFNKKEIIDLLIEPLENWYESEDENFNEECIQKLKNNPSDEFIFKLHQMIWGKENPEMDVENFLYYNTVENLKKIYSKCGKWVDDLTEDSKQKEICDSFSKRYKGDK